MKHAFGVPEHRKNLSETIGQCIHIIHTITHRVRNPVNNHRASGGIMTDSETDLGGCRKLEMLSAMGKYTRGFPQIDPFCEVTYLETCFVFWYNLITYIVTFFCVSKGLNHPESWLVRFCPEKVPPINARQLDLRIDTFYADLPILGSLGPVGSLS